MLPPAEIVNFRDFGGYDIEGGGRVRQDRLFRSGHLGDLGEVGRTFISAAGLTVIADLRYPKERAAKPSPWLGDLPAVLCPTGEPDDDAPHLVLLRSPDLQEQDIPRFYRQFYAAVPFDPNFHSVFAAFFRSLAQSGGPALIHCSIGKDRTGILAAIVLSALGVAGTDVMADYMKSRTDPQVTARIAEVELVLSTQLGRTVPRAIAERLMLVEEAYLREALAAIHQRCGTIEAYLEQLGIDPAALDRMRMLLSEHRGE